MSSAGANTSIDLDAAEFVPDAARQSGVPQPETAGQRRQHQGNPHPAMRPRGRRNGRHDACRGRRAGCCAAGHARMGRPRISRSRGRRLIHTQCVKFGLLVLERAFQLLEFAARGRLGCGPIPPGVF